MADESEFLKRFDHNFLSLQSATLNNKLCLVEAIRTKDNSPVALICAVNDIPGETVELVPLAEMIDGNPYEMFSEPNIPEVPITTYRAH